MLRRTAAHLTAPPEGRFRFVAVDVETANRKDGSICQIGLAFVGDGTVETFSMLVDPRGRFDPGNVRVHGIVPSDVRGAPRFPEALEVVRDAMERHPLVQHSRFDQRAFDAACRSHGLRSVDGRWSDSVQIARKAFPELKGAGGGHGLANLKRALGLTFRHHDAGEDARAAAQVVLAAEKRLGTIPALRWRAEQLEMDV
nr:3'-5' exonuclease [Jannaschia sp. Os4]